MIWGLEMIVPWKVHGRSLKWAGTQKGGDRLTRGSADGNICSGLGGAGRGGGALSVPFISYRKLPRMRMVKPLSTSQVPPYNLSQTISTMTIHCPFSPAGDSDREVWPPVSRLSGAFLPALALSGSPGCLGPGQWWQQGGGRGDPGDSDPTKGRGQC